MEKKISLTNDQKTKIQQLKYYYHEAGEDLSSSSDSELYSKLIRMDEDLRERALAFSVSEGIIGLLLIITGYNFLTMLSGAFLSGILCLCLGLVMLALAYPIYHLLLRKNRKKYAPVVLTITRYLD